MNLSLYKETELEKWISNKYRAAGIHFAYQLDIESIAEFFKIDIQYYHGPSVADWSDDYSVIFINAYLKAEERREVFFHELCHPLRHVGFQGVSIGKMFEDLQENQANLFQLYASMPAYMLEEFWDVSSSLLPKHLTEQFGLPERLVNKRLEQIKNRIYWEECRQDRQRRVFEKVTITEEHVRNVMIELGRKQKERQGRGA